MIRKLLVVAFLSTSAAAHAGDKPLYQPVPDWVKPAPPIDATKIKDDAPVILQLDTQQLLKNGEVWNYTDAATRAASQQVLDSIGTLKLPWLPDKGDLIIHKLEIIRGAEHIDLLAGGPKLSVLQREEGLEQRQLNGLLTATMPIEGLRIGDVLHIVASVTQKDAALGGNVQALSGVLADPFRTQFARVRLLWPEGDKISWKTNATGAVPQISDSGGYHQLEFQMPLAKQPEMPVDAPVRYRGPRLIEASSFADWGEISKVMAPLYKTDGLIAVGSPLATEVAKIKAAESDPLKRAELALELVQGKIRYLFRGMEGGNYVPQSPAQTWSLRYGDCKAKTLLLLALLRALDVKAEPVLASSQFGDMVPGRLASPASFDHVLVRATIGQDVIWLDGTSSGARLIDIHDTPPFGWVLPVRAEGAELVAIPFHPAARADARVDLAFDQTAGVGMPAPMKITAVYRGAVAQMIRAVSQQAGKDDLDKFATTVLGNFFGDGKIVTRTFNYDDATGEMNVAATGIAYPNWNREEERYRLTLDKLLEKVSFEPDRSRSAWRDIPVMTGNDGSMQIRTTVHLPDKGLGFTLDGADQLSDTLAGVRFERTTTVANGVLTIEEKALGTRAEIAPKDIAGERARVSRAKTHLLRENAPASYPALWQVVEAGKKNKRFDALLALFRQDIAARPDKAEPLTDLAWFHEKLYMRREAIDDLTKAIAIEPDADTYLKRARLLAALGDSDKAAADIAEARKIDPGSSAAITQLAELEADRGHFDQALELLDDRIAEGGKEKNGFVSTKATVLSAKGDKDSAISTIDGAIAASPGNADLLNTRCWVKGTLDVALDTALKDCSRAIELGESGSAALDSRAMVFFRMARFEEALAALSAAIDRDPDQAGSWFMRGVIHKQMGNAKASHEELTAARLMRPDIDNEYARFGIKP